MTTVGDLAAGLTGSRKTIYDFMVSYYTTNGKFPTFREIVRGTRLGLATVHYHAARLIALGLIVENNSERANRLRLAGCRCVYNPDTEID